MLTGERNLTQKLERVQQRLARWVPRIELTKEAFEPRHRVLRVILWVHIPLVMAVAAYTTFVAPQGDSVAAGGMDMGPQQETLHLIFTWVFVVGAVGAGALVPLMRTHRSKAVMVSLGLLMCADALVHGSGGQTDMHFDFFVVLALISLYQDWAVFALAIGTVAVHHGVIGAFAPAMVFSSPQALMHPVRYALLHAAFVLAMSAAQVAYWRFTQSAEEALRASTEEASRLALVARYTDNAVVITNPTGVIEWVNDAFTKMTGYSAEEAIGQPRVDLFHGPEGEQEMLESVFADLNHGVDVEFQTCDRTGRPYWLNLEARPILEDGRLVRLVGIERDVTARRSSEEHERAASRSVAALAEALAAEKSLLSGVISTIPHLVYWKDAAGRYAGANDAFLRWSGQAGGVGLIGHTEAELDPAGALNRPNGLISHLRAIESAVARDGQPVVDQHIAVTDSAGNPCSLLLSVLPQPGADGSAGGLIGVGADVTHLAELEQQLAQAHRLESIGQLAAGIAHEINTPVQFVSDNTRFVAESFSSLVPGLKALAGRAARQPTGDPADDDGATFRAGLEEALTGVDLAFLTDEVPVALEESLEGLTRIAQIVVAMKEFSHPGHASTAADLNRAVETTAQVSRNEWKYLARLDLDLDPEVGLVTCHEGDIKQVLLNMVVNAAHAIQERQAIHGDTALGTISIGTTRIADLVQITVADNGIGMDRATQQRIFDPFFTTKEVGKGTGQGLSIAHSSIVQKHNGTVTVASTYGQGTTFTITLPAPRDGGPEAAEGAGELMGALAEGPAA